MHGGGSYDIDQQLIFRPAPSLSRYRTPLRGLYLTGAATFPGAGIWGASGRNTAGIVLGDLDRRPDRSP